MALYNASQLKSEAISTGVPISGTKAQLIERILAHYGSVVPQNVTARQLDIVPKSVISVDVGYRNLAFAHVSKDHKVLQWRRVDLDIDNHHPSQSAISVTRFVRQDLLVDVTHPEEDYAIVIERQRFRSMGGHSVLEHTIRVNMVEAMLWSALQCMTGPGMTKEAVNAIAVEKYWSSIRPYPLPDAQNDAPSRSKKKRSEILVTDLLATNFLDCSSELQNMFAKESKKDDLSDSMLQALAWLNWRKYTQKHINDTLLY